MGNLTGVIGIVVLLGAAWLLSEHRSRIPWRLVLTGLIVQLVLAVLLLRAPIVRGAVDAVATLVNGVIIRADAGIEFIFGPQLNDPAGPWGFVFAVKVLPVIIFFASLMAVLYHLGVMQRIVAVLAWILRRTLGVTGTEALAMASNVFVGQTEAPLCIKPFIEKMTRAQIMTLMVGGFATIAGSVMAAYVGILGGIDEASRAQFIKHLLTASVMSAPAAFVIARIIVPETETPIDEGLKAAAIEDRATNVLDAAAGGASDGLRLALNVAAMLIAFVALLALINWPLQAFGAWGPIDNWLTRLGIEDLDLQTILAAFFSPLAWAMGVDWADTALVGTLMGEKLVLTEFIAFDHLGKALHTPTGSDLSARSAYIATYALCGFANFGSIAIQIGGLSSIAPGQRSTFVSLALRAMIGGAIASWMTAAVAGFFIV